MERGIVQIVYIVNTVIISIKPKKIRLYQNLKLKHDFEFYDIILIGNYGNALGLV